MKTAATLLQFVDEVYRIDTYKKKLLLEFWIGNNLIQNSSQYLENWRSYGWATFKQKYCLTYLGMSLVCGGTTSNERNFLNIDPNDLIIFWKKDN